jgi:capsular exopolysaccharide synthesis family protein
MARPIAGDPPANLPPAPYQTPANGTPAPAASASPFNYSNQPSMPAPGMPSAPTPSGLLHAFRRRWVLGTLLGLIAAAGAVAAVWSLLPSGKHETRAVVQIRSRSSELGGKSAEDFAEYRSRQVFLLKSRDLITRTAAEPAVGSLDFVKHSEDPVQMIEDQLKVKPATDDLILVTLTGNNLDDMKVFLDHLVKRYVDDAVAYDRKDMDDQVKRLERLAESLRFEIDAGEKQIQLLSKVNGTLGGQDNATRLALLQQQYVAAQADYQRVGRELLPLEAELDLLKKQLQEKKPSSPPDPAILKQLVDRDLRVIKAKTIRDLKKQEYDKALEVADGQEDVPFVVEKKKEAEKAQKEYDETVKTAEVEASAVARAIEMGNKATRATELETTIKIKKEVREKLKEEGEAYKKLIDQGVDGGVNIQAMRDALKPQKETLDHTLVKLAKLRLDKELGNRISMRGDVEKVPNYNQNKKVLLSCVGGLGSFVGVILLVAFLEWRTRRVDSVDQVVTELGMRVIGTVPAFPNRASLKAAVEAGGANWRFVLNESINSTRTMLLHAARSQSMQVVMVTSATQGEGKTSLASQLATSMATAGMRTLVIDCDLRNPSVQKLFELPLGPGVSEVLRQEIDVADVVQASTVPNLWVITAGQCSNATIAALAQGHPLETLFNRLRGQFDFVIVDSCPVLPVADALLIGQHVDGVVFSVMQDVSQLPKVMTASEKMTQLGIPLIGAVVNGIKQDVYSYGYNYVRQLPG